MLGRQRLEDEGLQDGVRVGGVGVQGPGFGAGDSEARVRNMQSGKTGGWEERRSGRQSSEGCEYASWEGWGLEGRRFASMEFAKPGLQDGVRGRGLEEGVRTLGFGICNLGRQGVGESGGRGDRVWKAVNTRVKKSGGWRDGGLHRRDLQDRVVCLFWLLG
jgi:hypothetical protein